MEPEKKQRKKLTGRKKKPVAEVKSFRYNVRFNEAENTELFKMVETIGTSVADFLRSKGLGAKSQVINVGNLVSSLDKIGAELDRSGNNINQLAKHTNTVNKSGKVDESIMSRFNVLFAEYIKSQIEVQKALRKIIREVGG